MSHQQHARRPDTETQILLALIAIFLLGSISSYAVGSPILTAVCVGLVVTALLYRFFGGVEGSTFTLATFKAGGSVAVFAFVTWFVNGQLVTQTQPPLQAVSPNPRTWIAIDTTGAQTPVTIGSETYSHDVSDFLRNAVWGVRLDSGMLRVTEREHDLGRIESPSLHQLGLFDHIEMSQGIGIQFTTQLTAGAEADLRPVYPFKIQTTQFSDNYNAFAVLDENDTVVLAHGLLRTRDFQFFEYGGNHYLIFVSRAVHNDPGAAPWAVFGFAQVSPILRLDQPVEQ